MANLVAFLQFSMFVFEGMFFSGGFHVFRVLLWFLMVFCWVFKGIHTQNASISDLKTCRPTHQLLSAMKMGAIWRSNPTSGCRSSMSLATPLLALVQLRPPSNHRSWLSLWRKKPSPHAVWDWKMMNWWPTSTCFNICQRQAVNHTTRYWLPSSPQKNISLRGKHHPCCGHSQAYDPAKLQWSAESNTWPQPSVSGPSLENWKPLFSSLLKVTPHTCNMPE